MPRPGSTVSTNERHQLPLLFWSSVRRLFENDLTPDSADVRQSVLWVAALFAMPPALLAVALTMAYSPWQPFEERALKALWDKQFFLGYSMVAVGCLTVLTWDAIFPDRRDSMVLGTLPVRARTIVAAKIAAVTAVILGFAVAVNVPATIAFSSASGGYEGAGHFARTLVGHAMSTILAGGFSFLVLLTLQTTLTLVLPRRALRTVSLVGQLVFVVFVIEWLVFGPTFLRRIVGADVAAMGAGGVPLTERYRLYADALAGGSAGWWPTTWFLGLYETIVFIEPERFVGLASTALSALAVVLVAALTTYTVSLRRVMGQTLETPGATHTGSGWSRVADRVLAVAIRHSVQRAVASFAMKSLVRSRRHRLLLAVYVGIGLALTIGSFVAPLLLGGTAGVMVSRPTVELLSVPLVLSFFSLVGLRVLFAIPTDLRSNWVFQITESADSSPYIRGARSVLLLMGLAPIAVLTLPLYWAVWGSGLALGHTVFWLLCGGVLTELLLVGFGRVPFTCSYVPGKANVKLLWPVYILAMTTYAYTTARIELWLFTEPVRILAGCLVVALLVGLLRSRGRWMSEPRALRYEEEAEPEVQTLGLMPRV